MRWLSCIVFLLLCAAVPAQVVLSSDPVASTGYGTHNVVRDAAGNLFSLSVSQDAGGVNSLLLLTSADGGQTWLPTGFTFNDATSGMNNNATQRTNVCSMAIDDLGTLHATWASYYYPSYYQQYYRNYNPSTLAASPVVNVSAITGAATTSRTAAMDIRVDGANTVWMVAHGTASWVERLIYSNNPYAIGETFTDAGNISMSASAQNTRICIDANGDVHCGYYRSTGPGEYWHRIYTPGIGWNPSTNLGNGSSAPHDYLGALCSDLAGNVHALIAIDSGTPATTWKFRYKRWDAIGGWSPETVLFDATVAQYTNIANYRIFDVACDATTGKVYAVYRDLSAGGMLRIAEKDLAASAFTVVTDLTPPSTAQHVYYLPAIRGTLYPAFNQTGTDLDVTWQYRATQGMPPYDLFFDRTSLGGPAATITLSAPAAIGTTTTVDLSSPADPLGAYVCGFSLSDTPGTTLPDSRIIPINLDLLFAFASTQGNGVFLNFASTLTGAGQGTVIINVPNLASLIGVPIYSAFVVADPMNATGIGTISPGLAITITM